GVLMDLAPKKVLLGVIDLNDPNAETPLVVADRIRAGLKFVAPDKLIPAPDCGMKYLPRRVAFAKLKALSEGAAIVRGELWGLAAPAVVQAQWGANSAPRPRVKRGPCPRPVARRAGFVPAGVSRSAS